MDNSKKVIKKESRITFSFLSSGKRRTVTFIVLKSRMFRVTLEVTGNEGIYFICLHFMVFDA